MKALILVAVLGASAAASFIDIGADELQSSKPFCGD
jgi:hypothetical protein